MRRISRAAAISTSAATKSAATESAPGWPARTSRRPKSTATEPARSLPKWSAFDASAGLEYARAARLDATVRADVDADDDADDEQRVPRGVHGRAAVDEPHDRAPDDGNAGEDEDRALAERREMLGLPVAVLVAGIGGAHGDADGEERQQRGDEIGARVRGLRDEAEAVRGEAGAELERDQRARREHRPERGFPLGLHGGKRTQGSGHEAIGSGGQMSASCRNAKWQHFGSPSWNGAIEASSISASAGLSSQRSWCISALASAAKRR